MPNAKTWLMLLTIVAALYLVVLLLVYVNQRKLLYFPSREAVSTTLTPWELQGHTIGYARDVPAPRKVWLVLHGNGGQAAQRDYIARCAPPTDAVFVLEYPGYGARRGQPSREAIDGAARDAYHALRARFAGMPLGVVGESLGTGPACVLARETPAPDQLVLITPFDTLASVAGEQYRFLPTSLLLRDRWDNVAALRDYRGPIHIYAAEYDRLIPAHHAKALAAATGAKLTLLPSGHNDWSNLGRVRLD